MSFIQKLRKFEKFIKRAGKIFQNLFFWIFRFCFKKFAEIWEMNESEDFKTWVNFWQFFYLAQFDKKFFLFGLRFF